MAKFTYDHIHLRSPNPDATALYYQRMFEAEVIRTMQQGKPRIDLKLGGVNIFIAPVASGDGVNPPPKTPYQGLDHFGLLVSCARRKGCRSSCSTATTLEPGVHGRSIVEHALVPGFRSAPSGLRLLNLLLSWCRRRGLFPARPATGC